MTTFMASWLTSQGEHVGNLKFINGVWKFKAIGYDQNGHRSTRSVCSCLLTKSPVVTRTRISS